VLNQWDLLAPLRFGPPDPEVDVTHMPLSQDACRSAEMKLREAGVDPGDRPLVVVHVSAGNPFRRWPAESFVSLVASLARTDPGRRILLLSGPSESEAARAIGSTARALLRRQPGEEAIVDGVELDLRELRATLEHAALFVGGDSGPLHIAGTTEVPIVALYGPTLAARSAPWRPARCATESIELPLECRPCDQRRCSPGDFRCLGRILPETVAAAAERALAVRR
jgi:ADP-heptose:LPS heptosyltransferase